MPREDYPDEVGVGDRLQFLAPPGSEIFRRERAAPVPIGRGKAAGFSRRITLRYASRDSAKRRPTKQPRVSPKTPNPRDSAPGRVNALPLIVHGVFQSFRIHSGK